MKIKHLSRSIGATVLIGVLAGCGSNVSGEYKSKVLNVNSHPPHYIPARMMVNGDTATMQWAGVPARTYHVKIQDNEVVFYQNNQSKELTYIIKDNGDVLESTDSDIINLKTWNKVIN